MQEEINKLKRELSLIRNDTKAEIEVSFNAKV